MRAKSAALILSAAVLSGCTSTGELPGISMTDFAERAIACAGLYEAERRAVAERGSADGALVINTLVFRNAAINAVGLSVDEADLLVEGSAGAFAPLFTAAPRHGNAGRVDVAAGSEEARGRLVAGYAACRDPAAAAAADNWPPQF
ncbi:MAG: hypothetical protein AAF698_00395 [Pseudomonadota bacterium]